jgi:hypothetical protein
MRIRISLLGIVVVLLAAFALENRSLKAVEAGTQIRPVIGFEGLVALIRSQAFDRGAVVLVDPTRATLHRDLPAHRAILTIPMAAVKSGTPDAFADAEHRIGLWELKDYRVEFGSSAAAGPLRPIETASSVVHPRTANEWRDVKWIVSMDRLVGEGRGGIRSHLMTSTDLRNSILSARVSLGAGTIEATEPAAPWNQNEVRFLVLKGLTSDRPVQQAATQKLLYKPQQAESFRISLKPSDGGLTREIELKATGGEIPISISNHSTMDTLMNHEFPHQALHFLAYYDLLATPAAAPVVPTSLVPYPTTRTEASPGFFCMGDPPMFTWSFEND